MALLDTRDPSASLNSNVSGRFDCLRHRYRRATLVAKDNNTKLISTRTATICSSVRARPSRKIGTANETPEHQSEDSKGIAKQVSSPSRNQPENGDIEGNGERNHEPSEPFAEGGQLEKRPELFVVLCCSSHGPNTKRNQNRQRENDEWPNCKDQQWKQGRRYNDHPRECSASPVAINKGRGFANRLVHRFRHALIVNRFSDVACVRPTSEKI